MGLREVDNVEEAARLLSQGWVLRSTHTVSKIVYVLEKISPQPQEVQEKESKTLKEILDVPSQVQPPMEQEQTPSYDILPWKGYPSGKGSWVFSSPEKYPNLGEEARNALETLKRELELKGTLEDNMYTYSFSTDPSFIRRVPKEKKG